MAEEVELWVDGKCVDLEQPGMSQFDARAKLQSLMEDEAGGSASPSFIENFLGRVKVVKLTSSKTINGTDFW